MYIINCRVFIGMCYMYPVQQKFSTDFKILSSFLWIRNISFNVIYKYVDLIIKITCVRIR